tara:strand:+ start:860 stop:8206 length:7347 start_codon:yes stop_codon:yes gene_type:complete
MATRIKLKRSTTATTVPTTSNLEDGEVAVNIADQKLYARNGAAIVEIANQKPNTGEVTTAMLATDITNGPGSTYYVSKNGADTTTLANSGAGGKHPDTAFLTITKALATATSGDSILVSPGEYQEVFPMTVPDGVTLRGTNLRATSVKPTSVTQSNTAFKLSGDCHVSDLTIKDFFYDSGNDDGYAFELVSSLNSDRSPYVERCTVSTKGSVTSGADPYGFAQGDAGRGAKLDGAQINAASQHAAVLFNECTFIVPNSIGILCTNGVRVEWLNGFIYFAAEGIKGLQGATGKYGAGKTRLKLGGTSGTFSAAEIVYQLEDGFQSGTYVRSGTTVTLTRTGHGLASNDYIYADHISGGATDNFYQVTVVDANTFTYTDAASGTITANNVTYKKAVGRGVIDSNDGTYIYISGKGTGIFTTSLKPVKVLSRFGDTQIDTAQKKFGTASFLFDGTQDNLMVPTGEDFGLGTSNFCLEAFVRPNSVTGIQHIFDLRDASATDTAGKLYLNGTALHYGVGNSSTLSGGTLAIGTWYHVAVARNGGTTKLFLDGTELATGADTNDYGSTKPVAIGSNYDTSAPAEALNGWIDEVRFSKGAARFTGAFTPTTSEYTSDNNTVLLLHGNGTDASTTFTDESGGTSDVRSNGGDSATSVVTADYSEFGCEVRALSSTNVYGTKGAVADGAGTKLNLTAHQFAYVGAGSDYTNDPSLAVQANEVEELNNGKVFYSSTDHKGDFRVGTAFTVDQQTGNVQFEATSTAQSAANITLTDGTGTTNIYPAYVETGNLRLAGNSLTSTAGKIILDPAGDEDITLNGQVVCPENIYFDSNRLASILGTGNSSCAFTVGTYAQAGFSSYGIFSNRNFGVNKKSLNDTGTGLTITNEGTGYTPGAYTAQILSNPDQVATATATLSANGAIGTINITNGGSLYTHNPTVAANLTPVTGTTAFIASMGDTGDVGIIAVASGGAGYSTPTGTFTAPPDREFDANTAIANNAITYTTNNFRDGDKVIYDNNTNSDLTNLTNGTTYYVVNRNTTTFTIQLAATSGGTPIALTATGAQEMHIIRGFTAVAGAVTVAAGAITAVAISDRGSGYTIGSSPTLTMSETGGGVTDATFTITLGTDITSVSTTGDGVYASIPTLSFTNDTNDTTGSGAAATVANLTFTVASVTLSNGGYGYSSVPIVSFSGGGTPTNDAVATATLDTELGQVGSVALTQAGEGYSSTPTVVISGGSGTGGTAGINILPVGGNITAAGSGYVAGTYANVSFTGGSGTNAAATFTVRGLFGTITGGSGYTASEYNQIDVVNLNRAATWPVTVAARHKIPCVSSGITGTVNVGDTATGATSGATGTVTDVGNATAGIDSFVYVTVTSGVYQAAEVVNFTSGGSLTTSGLPEDINRYFINIGAGAVEAPDLTMIRGNTYRFDMSDATVAGHPLVLDATSQAATSEWATFSYGTPGNAGAYVDVMCKASATIGATAYYECSSHGRPMSENATINVTTGTAGESGSGAQLDITVVGGAVTAATFSTGMQGSGYNVGDVLVASSDTLIGNGTGFQYTITGNDTGIFSVTDIQASGSGYAVNDQLSVADADVGNSGVGAGFVFTVTKAGYADSATIAEGNGGSGFFSGQTVVFDTLQFGGMGAGSNFAMVANDIVTTSITTIAGDGSLTSGNFNFSTTGTLTVGTGTTSTLSSDTLSTTNVQASGNATISTDATVGGTFGVTGISTFSGNIAANGTDNFIENARISIQSGGTAAAPTITLSNEPTTGIYRSAADEFSIAHGGVQKHVINGTSIQTAGDIIADSTIGNAAPFFKVDSTAETLTVGSANAGLVLNNAAVLTADGQDANIPVTITPKGTGDMVITGAADREFQVNDGNLANKKFFVDTQTGDTEIAGSLKIDEKLKFQTNSIENADIGGTNSFGEILTVAVTGTGTGYTDGSYSACTVTATTGIGTAATFDVTVSGGAITAATVTAAAKGHNYHVGDEITFNPATIGGGSGNTVTITDTQGQGIVLKPGGGKSAYVKSTGSLIIPAGTTNQRPLTNDRIAGAIRFNSTQQQFEGYNGNDFVSLGGVRDVDQDTYILTESSPNADEDTFEFFAAGINNLSLNNTTLAFKTNMTGTTYATSHLATVTGGYTLKGTLYDVNPLNVLVESQNIVSVRAKKDLEVTGGLRLRNVPAQGVAATLDPATLTQVATSYTASQTFTGVTTASSVEGSGATLDIVVDGAGTVTTVTINAGGTGYEAASSPSAGNGEVLRVLGTALGGLTPSQDVTIRVDTISSASTPYTRNDILLQDYITRLDAKAFIALDSNASECKWKINRNWQAGGTESYLTVFDSTADFVELDDCRVEGGQMTSFASNASITAFDKTAYKGAKTLITIESDDGKVQMFEVTAVCSAAGTVAHATVTNSITSDNDLMDATVAVAANNVNISLNKSSAATSSTSFTGRYTTTKVKV